MSVARLTPLMKARLAPSSGAFAARTISSTARMDKGPIAATKDTLKKADRTVSDAAVKGLDKGEQASQKIKEVVGSTTREAKGKAAEMKGEAAEYTGQGKGKAEETMGEMKGKTQEAMGEAAGKAKEAKRSHLG